MGFSASSENAGIVFDVFGNNGEWNPDGNNADVVTIGDNAYVWVKPIEMLTLKFGKIDNNWGRQDVCFGMCDHTYRFGGLREGEGVAVKRESGRGAEITLQPIENLVIDYEANIWCGNEHTYETMWEHSSTMIGYTIPDVAFIRAVINGKEAGIQKATDTDTKPWCTIGLAADVYAVENLWFTVGATVPTLIGSGNLVDIPVGLGASYKLDPITFHAIAKLNFIAKADGDDAKYEDVGLYFGVGVDYTINDMFDVIADFRFGDKKYVAGVNGEDPAFAAYLGLAQKLSNATFDFGVQVGRNSGISYDTNATDPQTTFAVPLMITPSF